MGGEALDDDTVESFKLQGGESARLYKLWRERRLTLATEQGGYELELSPDTRLQADGEGNLVGTGYKGITFHAERLLLHTQRCRRGVWTRWLPDGC